MSWSCRRSTVAGFGAVALLCASLLMPPPARADDPCVDPQSATVLDPGIPVQGSLSSSTSVSVYAFEVTQADTVVTVTITDPYERLYPYLDSSCAIDGAGGGRHLDGGDWSRVGNDWEVSFDAGAYVGDYYVTVASASSNTTFPATFAIEVELAD